MKSDLRNWLSFIFLSSLLIISVLVLTDILRYYTIFLFLKKTKSEITLLYSIFLIFIFEAPLFLLTFLLTLFLIYHFPKIKKNSITLFIWSFTNILDLFINYFFLGKLFLILEKLFTTLLGIALSLIYTKKFLK